MMITINAHAMLQDIKSRLIKGLSGVFRPLLPAEPDLRGFSSIDTDFYQWPYKLFSNADPLSVDDFFGKITDYNRHMYKAYELARKDLTGKGMKLPVVLGNEGEESERQVQRYVDITDLPHMLIAGSSGSGKSVFMTNLLLSLFFFCHPEYLRIVLLDTKRVAFMEFGRVATLAKAYEEVNEVITKIEAEMDERYKRFELRGVKNIRIMNALAYRTRKPELVTPHLVVLFDEFADFSLQCGKDIMKKLIRLMQLGRAAGIHLLFATQRPDRQVVNGLIKANFEARAIFKVTEEIDSRIAFGSKDGFYLRGKGHFLFKYGVERFNLQGPLIHEEALDPVAHNLEAKGLRFGLE